MGANVIEGLVGGVFEHFRFLEKVTIFSVDYINRSFTNLHIVYNCNVQRKCTLLCLVRSDPNITLLMNGDKN